MEDEKKKEESKGVKLEKIMKDGSICKMSLPSEKDITPLIESDPRIKVVEEWTKAKKEK